MDKDLFLLFSILILLILILYINCNKINFTNLFTNSNKIDKIYVINLKKNSDRLKVFMKRAKKANVKVKRFNAIYGKDLPVNHPYINKYFVKNHNLNPGQIGCALSHIKIWEDAIKNNYKNIIVFEDDAIIPKDFWDIFNKYYNELPANYDMLLLGGVKLGGIQYKNSKYLLTPDKRCGNWGTSSILINIEFIKKIINEIKFNKPIDNYLIDNYYYNQSFNIFFVNKTIIKIDYSFNSNIGIGVQNINYEIKIFESITNNNIDKNYVINLKKNKKRLNVFMKKVEEANVNVERFDAIYGKDLTVNHPYINKYFVKNHNLNPGQIGCALSHIKIWEDAIKNNYKNIIVFEDDAIIPKDFWDKFNKYYNELPENYDMLLLGCCTCTGNTLNKKNLIKANSNGNWCLTGYLININYCKKLIERIKKNKINQGIDNYLRKNYHMDNVYIPLPPFILQDKTMESDIIMGDLGNTLQIDNNKFITWGN